MASNSTMDDLLYNELLASTGYDVDFAVGMTYSLDLEAMLSVPMAFGMFGELDETARKSPLYLLEAIRKSADKFIIFCNKGEIKVPRDSQKVYSLLEKSICEVYSKFANKSFSHFSNFHPKLWIIKETCRENKNISQIKLIVLSRNLTFDNSLDVALAMTGKISSAPNTDHSKQQPLIELLNNLRKYTNAEQWKKIKSLIDALAHVERFDLDEPFEDYDFAIFNNEGHIYSTIESDIYKSMQGQQMIVFSPFIDAPTLRWINSHIKKGGEHILVTRKESITPEIFNDYNSQGGQIYIMKDGMVDNDISKIDLHAKMYFVSAPASNYGNYLFLGSANATRTAFNSPTEKQYNGHLNTEILVRLKYRRSRNRTENFKAEFINDSPECKFERLSFLPNSATTDNVAKYTVAERIFKSIICSNLMRANVVTEGNNSYNINIYFNAKKLGNAGQCSLRLAPLQMPTNEKDLTDGIVFANVPTESLSEFFILSVSDGNDHIRRVVKLETKGIPSDRDCHIFQSFINTEEKFLKYVSLMLTDSPSLELYEILLAEAEQTKTAACNKGTTTFMPQFYEQLLRIAASEPERLAEIDNLISKLGKGVIPPAFNQMYSHFHSLTSKLKRL